MLPLLLAAFTSPVFLDFLERELIILAAHNVHHTGITPESVQTTMDVLKAVIPVAVNKT